MTVSDQEVLARFRADVERVYGDRLDRLVLYGSRARGDAQSDSDYDIAVFLHDKGRGYEEGRLLSCIEADILDDMGALVSAQPFESGDIEKSTLFMGEIRREGRFI